MRGDEMSPTIMIDRGGGLVICASDGAMLQSAAAAAPALHLPRLPQEERLRLGKHALRLPPLHQRALHFP